MQSPGRNFGRRLGRLAIKFLLVVVAITVGIPVALAGLLLALWGLSFRDPAPDQDNCAFGSVSNAEYRRLLAEAKAQDWTVWPGLSNGLFSPTDHGPLTKPTMEWFFFGERDIQEFKTRLGQHFKRSIEQLTFDHSSSDAQLAGAHAVMRSIHAEYVSVGETLSYHSSDGQVVPSKVEFSYFLPQIRFAPLCLRCLIFPHTTLDVFFRRNSTDILDLVVVQYSDFKYAPDKTKERNAGPCPTFPPHKPAA